MKKTLNIFLKILIVVCILFLICTICLFLKLYTMDEVIWDEVSPQQSYSVVVTKSGFLIASTIRVYVKKEEDLLRTKLFEEDLMQDLRSVCDGDISTQWSPDGKCILYIEGETEYIQATISVDIDGHIECDYIKQSLFE